MKRLFCLGIVGLLASLPLAASAADMATAEIIGTDKAVIGKATLEQTPNGVLLLVEVEALPPGAHGIHLHGVSACEPDFKAAKGHVNPGEKPHGLRNPEGPDNGDLPNLFVGADGRAKAEFFTTRVSVSGDAPALLDDDGSAIIIHENPDDHLIQPIGGAGGRIACGMIKKM